MAPVFVLTGFLGLVFTLVALRTRWYRELSDEYAAPVTPASAPAG